MEHLTDDELVLHFYGDGVRDEEAAVDRHLRECSACKALWEQTAEALKLVDIAKTPEPDEQFEARIWARVQPALRQAADTDEDQRVVSFPSPRRTSVVSIAAAVGLAAAVALAVYVGRSPRAAQPETAPAATQAADATSGRERVLLTALDDHFQRSEMLLVELMNAPATTTELGFEREAAGDLVDSGRLYRAAAQQDGNVRLAQLLEELEAVLVEIARSPDRMDGTDLRSLRTRVEDDDLLFKVRAVSQQIQDRRKSLLTE